MIDLEKILVKIVLILVTALFIILLFNSCKTTKKVIKTEKDSTIAQVVVVDSHTSDNSKTEEDYTEITYVLDSGQKVIVNFGDGKVNYGSEELKVTQIKVKNSHVTKENDIDNKIYATEEKKAEIEEKTAEKTKEKPITRKIVVLSIVSFLLGFFFFLFIKYRH